MKTEAKYKDKLSKLKNAKRKACQKGNFSNNSQIKKIKEEFKAERRAIKRGEKNVVKKEIEKEIDGMIKSNNKRSRRNVIEMFPFNFFKNV